MPSCGVGLPAHTAQLHETRPQLSLGDYFAALARCIGLPLQRFEDILVRSLCDGDFGNKSGPSGARLVISAYKIQRECSRPFQMPLPISDLSKPKGAHRLLWNTQTVAGAKLVKRRRNRCAAAEEPLQLVTQRSKFRMLIQRSLRGATAERKHRVGVEGLEPLKRGFPTGSFQFTQRVACRRADPIKMSRRGLRLFVRFEQTCRRKAAHWGREQQLPRGEREKKRGFQQFLERNRSASAPDLFQRRNGKRACKDAHPVQESSSVVPQERDRTLDACCEHLAKGTGIASTSLNEFLRRQPATTRGRQLDGKGKASEGFDERLRQRGTNRRRVNALEGVG
ncbi:MAG: hypothetical protein AAF411_10805 [Myxococcota bacterium]